ncbi:ABC transporter substrate-binding protein [Herbidospora daliensis]|uniref:ABC transporter substrate-binding protein n=1 Tax=Herbidospora daliensis TaxID=295585 RepID=UPI0007826615|nr:ABC transporter substrate-binding protein [Herbidospora daliensis]
MTFRKTRLAACASAGILTMLLSACGGGTPAASDDSGLGPGRGPIVFASGKDFTAEMNTLLAKWNEAHPQETVKMLELSASPDDQRASFVQNFQAKSSAYDVLWSDVVWTSEFASRGWLEPLDKAALGGPDILPTAVQTAEYDGKLYGAPFITNAALLFYRKDLVPEPPTTWAEMWAACDEHLTPEMSCYAGQFAQYEGLTVNAAEAVNGAGGAFLSDDGKTVAVDSPEARAGLQTLVDAMKNGKISKDAITYKEEESRRAFVEGRLMFLRNWPYVYTSAGAADSAVKDKFGTALLPGVNGPGSSSLGGIDLVVSAFSKHKETAKDWIAFMQSEETQRFVVAKMNQASVRAALYDDPELIAQSPYLPTLKQSLTTATPRPRTADYNAVTLAVQTNAYAALQGGKSVDQAITDMASQLSAAIAQ